MNLYDLILRSAEAAITYQKNNGSFPAGHNGPYLDAETPVRNTSHWLIILLKAYKISQNQKYIDGAKQALEYLLSSEARPMNATFWHRKNSEKDFSNGLIGQAWTIEALIYAYKFFDDPKVLKEAQKVFLLHPYNRQAGGWRIVNVDGSHKGLDSTFNHQLWFAAAGSLLIGAGVQEVKSSVDNFLNRLNDHLKLYRDGLIKHISPFFLNEGLQNKAYKIYKHIRKNYNRLDYIRKKSVGYHGFNLHGFALIKKELPAHPVWKNPKISKVFEYAKSEKFWNEIENSKYGFPYNPPGFEIAYALQEFELANEDQISAWVSRQIKNCYNFESGLMSLCNTKDEHTLAARMYEATRLKNYKLNV